MIIVIVRDKVMKIDMWRSTGAHRSGEEGHITLPIHYTDAEARLHLCLQSRTRTWKACESLPPNRTAARPPLQRERRNFAAAVGKPA